MNYIVKNCPCYDHDYEECLNTFRDEYKKCYDCTDCVIKQVIEKCKDSKLNYSKLGILRTACETNQAYGKAVMTEQILQLFDIEEVK